MALDPSNSSNLEHLALFADDFPMHSIDSALCHIHVRCYVGVDIVTGSLCLSDYVLDTVIILRKR